jgi:adenosylcobinamide-GDP ribazoletransferase
LIALLVGAGTLFGCKALLKRMLGGQTGDTIGATQLTLEIAILSSFMLSVGL